MIGCGYSFGRLYKLTTGNSKIIYVSGTLVFLFMLSRENPLSLDPLAAMFLHLLHQESHDFEICRPFYWLAIMVLPHQRLAYQCLYPQYVVKCTIPSWLSVMVSCTALPRSTLPGQLPTHGSSVTNPLSRWQKSRSRVLALLIASIEVNV